jgi:hypothetical protein
MTDIPFTAPVEPAQPALIPAAPIARRIGIG